MTVWQAAFLGLLQGATELFPVSSLGHAVILPTLLGSALAGAAAYGSARFLLRYFRSGRLDPYAWYCVTVGIGSRLLLR